MAIRLVDVYPNQVDGQDPGYPYGKARNIKVTRDGTGTPLEQTWLNDLFGFLQALLVETGIAPSGVPDRVGGSDHLEALRRLPRLFRAVSNPDSDFRFNPRPGLPNFIDAVRLTAERTATFDDAGCSDGDYYFARNQSELFPLRIAMPAGTLSQVLQSAQPRYPPDWIFAARIGGSWRVLMSQLGTQTLRAAEINVSGTLIAAGYLGQFIGQNRGRYAVRAGVDSGGTLRIARNTLHTCTTLQGLDSTWEIDPADEQDGDWVEVKNFATTRLTITSSSGAVVTLAPNQYAKIVRQQKTWTPLFVI